MEMDTVSLDQLRALAVFAQEGSFSGAARRLRRVQSAVSQAMSKLEESLGVVVFDRSARTPSLTPAGEAVLAAARRVCAEADALHALAASLRGGTEAAVSLCVDALFPLRVLAPACRLSGALQAASDAFFAALDHHTIADLVARPTQLRRLLAVR